MRGCLVGEPFFRKAPTGPKAVQSKNHVEKQFWLAFSPCQPLSLQVFEMGAFMAGGDAYLPGGAGTFGTPFVAQGTVCGPGNCIWWREEVGGRQF